MKFIYILKHISNVSILFFFYKVKYIIFSVQMLIISRLSLLQLTNRFAKESDFLSLNQSRYNL